MNADDLSANLGTVASSGTLKFLEEAVSNAARPELIGQFGVGFYSCFMVADRVTVKSRKAGEESCWLWESDGTEEYTVAETEGLPVGTSVVLQMKEDSREYLEKWKIESLVKLYSDFVSNPVYLAGENEEGKSREQINTGTPVWLRNPADVEESEYNGFYSHLTHDHSDPLDRFWYHGEGVTEFYALVYIPSSRGMEIMIPDHRPGLSLYARKVMIMERADKILPQYLHFLRGVVESSDIALNVSREMLQQDRVLRTISKALTRKLLDHFSKMMNEDVEKYRKFYENYGDFIKEGVYSDHERREDLAELLLFHTKGSDELQSLASICEDIPEEAVIYYLAGSSLDELKRSPHLESTGSHPVLLLHGPIDLLAVETLAVYKDRKLVNLASEAVEKDLSQEEKDARAEAEKEHGGLINSVRDVLGDAVSGVRFSPRLRETPCILVSSRDDPGEMVRMMMRAMNQDAPESKKLLELTPAHPLIGSLEEYRKTASEENFRKRVKMLLELARVLSGTKPDDPLEFGRFVAELMTE
jgi:molecular chaperone HtpG